MRASALLWVAASLFLALAPAAARGEEGGTPGGPGGEAPAAPGEEPAAKPDKPPEPPPQPPIEDKGIVQAGNGLYNLSIAGRRPDAAFKELFDASGRSIPVDLAPDAPPVTLSLSGASFWQAVDGIAREARAYLWGAFVPGGPRLRPLPPGRAGRAPWAAYSGALRLSLEAVETRLELGPGGAAEPSLELLAWGLPEPGVRIFVPQGLGPSTGAAAVRALDAQGGEVQALELRLAPAGDGFRLAARVRRPAPGVQTLAEVRITFSLDAAGEIETVEVADAAAKAGRETAGRAFRVKVEEAGPQVLTVLVSGPGLREPTDRRLFENSTQRPELRVLDAENREIPATAHLERVAEGIRYKLALSREAAGPVTLRYSGFQGRERRDFEFTFKDVPLP
jgi:hypothetical protein